MSRLDLALYYLRKGWSVIPCHVPVVRGECSCGRSDCSWPGKHPRVSWREYSDRLPTEIEVKEWFGDVYYGSNIGVVTGQISKLVVLDVDGDPERFRELGLPKTLTAATGGGGRHHFYRCTKPVRSRGKEAFVEGIDLKADGGFIVLPPSIHKSGQRYRWIRKMPPAKLDPSLLPVPAEVSLSTNGRHAWYHEMLAGVEEGARSNVAAKLAGRYAHLGLSREEAWLLMSRWNEMNRPPLLDSDLKRTMLSVYDKHLTSSGGQIDSVSDLLQWLSDAKRRRE